MGFSSEGAVVAELQALRRSPLWPDHGAPAGGGRAVLLVNGFGMPPATLAPLARWLRGGGWAAHIAAVGWNIGCGEVAAGRLCSAIQALGQDAPVAIVGHSRGGLVARVAAVRLPDEVSNLVTVCTPWTPGPPDRPGVALVAGAVRFLRRHGMEAMGSIDCADGSCCERFRDDMGRTPRATWTAIWSNRDGVAGDDATPPTEADHTVDTSTTHLGAVASIAGWTAIGAALSAAR